MISTIAVLQSGIKQHGGILHKCTVIYIHTGFSVFRLQCKAVYIKYKKRTTLIMTIAEGKLQRYKAEWRKKIEEANSDMNSLLTSIGS